MDSAQRCPNNGEAGCPHRGVLVHAEAHSERSVLLRTVSTEDALLNLGVHHCDVGELSIAGLADEESDVPVLFITGFDVDGKVSDLSDQETCFKADYLSNTPEMTPGIDNEMGVALARLGVDDNFNDGFVNAIQRGDLLTLLEISDIDDYENDPCVHVDFLVGTLPSGVTAPMVDGDGRLTLDQTLDVREMSYSSPGGPARYRMRDARIVSGRLEGTVEEFNLPTPVPTEFVALGDVPQFMVRLETAFAEEGFDEGVLGGAMSIEATVAGARNGGAEPDIQDAVRSLMVGAADLYPIDNECRCASVGYTVSGRRVTRGSVVP